MQQSWMEYNCFYQSLKPFENHHKMLKYGCAWINKDFGMGANIYVDRIFCCEFYTAINIFLLILFCYFRLIQSHPPLWYKWEGVDGLSAQLFVGFDVIWRYPMSIDPPYWIRHLGFSPFFLSSEKITEINAKWTQKAFKAYIMYKYTNFAVLISKTRNI